MRSLLAGGVALFLATSTAQAQVDESWTCAYSAYYGGGMVVRFLRDGPELVDERFQVRYRIVQDTPEALIAMWSDSGVASDAAGPGISSAVILIDKRTGDFTRSNATVPNQEGDQPISGTCIRGSH